MRKFTMKRRGKFDIKLAEGNECGLPGLWDFRYEWVVISTKLDERAFVVDHHHVHHAIEQWAAAGQYRGSCERLAVALGEIVIEHLHPAVKKSDPFIRVELFGSDVASIAVEGKIKDFRSFKPKFEKVDPPARYFGQRESGRPFGSKDRGGLYYFKVVGERITFIHADGREDSGVDGWTAASIEKYFKEVKNPKFR